MAASQRYYALPETVRTDGLCPYCFLPSLRTYTLIKLDIDGVTTLGTRVMCRDQQVWTTALKPFEETK
jgi:hypothetical protein